MLNKFKYVENSMVTEITEDGLKSQWTAYLVLSVHKICWGKKK